MSTAYRRKLALREMLAKDDATRRVADGVSLWHMRDVKDLPCGRCYSHGQLIFGIACGFCAGVVAAVFVFITFGGK